MKDPRIEKLADVIVKYSVALKEGEVVVIKGDPIAQPLILALFKSALEVGAYPHIRMAPDEVSELMLKYASPKQLEYVSPLAQFEVEKIDATISIWAEVNTKALSNTDSQKHAMMSAARKPIMSRFMQRAAQGELKWSGTLFPTQASAQDAGMSLTEYEEFVFNAGLLNTEDPVAAWQEVAKRQQEVVDLLNGSKTVHLQAANGTDLTMSVKGRTWINCCGKENFPDGEVFTSPVEDSVNGIICFSFPAVHMGHECEGVKLEFENGRVIKATAEKGQDFLLHMLDQDEGARTAGEFAIGTNYGITEYSKNTLFDEKIGGTVHLAVGASYPETGGKNDSGLHWDMVCDMRPGGQIMVDEKLIYENGKFTTVNL